MKHIKWCQVGVNDTTQRFAKADRRCYTVRGNAVGYTNRVWLCSDPRDWRLIGSQAEQGHCDEPSLSMLPDHSYHRVEIMWWHF